MGSALHALTLTLVTSSAALSATVEYVSFDFVQLVGVAARWWLLLIVTLLPLVRPAQDTDAPLVVQPRRFSCRLAASRLPLRRQNHLHRLFRKRIVSDDSVAHNRR